jgi:hypothetical protein
MEWLGGLLLALVALAVLALIYYLSRINPNPPLDDGAPMPAIFRRILVSYLLLFGSALVFLLVSLLALDYPETAPQPAPASAPATSQSTNQAPVLTRAFTTWSPDSISVLLDLYGHNFRPGAQVHLNMQERATKRVDDNLIEVTLQPADTGVVAVDVTNLADATNPAATSNVLAVTVSKPAAQLHIFISPPPLITRELQLALLALLAGALGSYVHAIKSLTDFIGSRSVTASWFWWYIARPFLGMAMALIFYAVVRGGFLAGTPADAKVVNPFGVLAIGALVGMFADKAAQKLGDVFDTLFTSKDTRSDKLGAPTIDKLSPNTVRTGQASPVKISVIGDRLGKTSTVRLNADERKPDTVTDKEVALTLRPEDVQTSRQIKVTIVTADGTVSASATLNVSDLEISQPQGAALPDAQVGVAYTAQVAASGGSPPFKWTIENGPKWLSIENDGALKGTPTAPGAVKTPITVADKIGATATREFDLTVVPK